MYTQLKNILCLSVFVVCLSGYVSLCVCFKCLSLSRSARLLFLLFLSKF